MSVIHPTIDGISMKYCDKFYLYKGMYLYTNINGQFYIEKLTGDEVNIDDNSLLRYNEYGFFINKQYIYIINGTNVKKYDKKTITYDVKNKKYVIKKPDEKILNSVNIKRLKLINNEFSIYGKSISKNIMYQNIISEFRDVPELEYCIDKKWHILYNLYKSTNMSKIVIRHIFKLIKATN